MATLEDAGLALGDRVELHSIVRRPELNSRHGMIRFYDAVKGRCHVVLDDGDGLAIKLQNLRVAESQKSDAHSQYDMMARWRAEEEARVAASPAPPLWDEDVEPEYADSAVLTDDRYIKIVSDMYCGASADQEISQEIGPGQYDAEFLPTVLMTGAIFSDLPLMKAVLRRGASLEARGRKGGTALNMAVMGCARDGEMDEKFKLLRCRLKTIRFLLEIGADPNAQEGTQHRWTPLHEAAMLRSKPLATKLFELLLAHKADPTLRDEEGMTPSDRAAGSIKRLLRDVVNKYKTSVRPAPLCPCGSGVLLESCHGRGRGPGDGEGVPLHPRIICQCKGNRAKSSPKTYADCCLRQRVYLRETLTNNVEPPRMIVGEAAKTMADFYSTTQQMYEAQGLSHEEIQNKPLFDGMTSDAVDGMFKAAAHVCLQPLVEQGRVDPAYFYAAKRMDWMPMEPANALATLNKQELKLRAREWNEQVDKYIASSGDGRTALEISKVAKISAGMLPLYARCANPECAAIESEPNTFQMCSKCAKVMPGGSGAKFCSQDCLRACWKRSHKAVCGTPDALDRLPSEQAGTMAYHCMARGMSATPFPGAFANAAAAASSGMRFSGEEELHGRPI